MSQLGFEFDAPPERLAPPAAVPRVTRAPNPLTLSPEDMARQLAQHADYRVLRRLVPVTDYGAAQPSADASGWPPVTKVLILDTETTGLSHESDQIIELALLLVAVNTASGQAVGPVESFEGFEDPGRPIPSVAKQITGISDDMVRGQRLDDARVEALLEKADLVIAHNAAFDRPFMEARFPAFAHKPWACSFADIDWKAQGSESAKLSALAQDRGWFYDAHRALVDCHAVLQVLASTAPEAPSGGAQTGLARLMSTAAQPSYKLRATGAPFESKDVLKNRGYRWDAQARVWSCMVRSEPALNTELEWLQAEVYGGRRASVEFEAMDALTRYSLRPGQIERRSI